MPIYPKSFWKGISDEKIDTNSTSSKEQSFATQETYDELIDTINSGVDSVYKSDASGSLTRSALSFRKEIDTKRQEDMELEALAQKRAEEARRKAQKSKGQHSFSFEHHTSSDTEENYIHVYTDDKKETYGISIGEISRFTGEDYNINTTFLLPVDLKNIPQELLRIQDVSSRKLSLMKIKSDALQVRTDNMYGNVVSMTTVRYGKIMNAFYDVVNPKHNKTL